MPSTLLTIACSKLFYTEPLILEAFVLWVLAVLSEKFNHNTVLYGFAYRNKLVRAVSCYFGNGVYHQMHHSSKSGDEAINLGNEPFLIWDRVFGSYRSPTPEPPTVGLTNLPQIKLNPLRILLGGAAQLAYEFAKNKNAWTRCKIVFGSSSYVPPISKDFLITGNGTRDASLKSHVPP